MALDEAALRSRAEHETGLRDWGGDEFIRPYRELVAAINLEAQLNPLGERRSADYLVQRLSQRLRLFADRRERPEIAAQKIERPIFITGMPRAGTTFLHALLAADPAAVAPLFWQLLSPSPPANAPGIDHSVTIERMRSFLKSFGWLEPDMLVVHDFDVNTPEECPHAFELSFVAGDMTGWWHIPSYAATLARDYRPPYAIHRKVLQALQIGAEGRRWVLKAPEHCLHLDTLLATYPDAVIVQHHRDPAKVMASMLSLLDVMRRRYSDARTVDAQESRRFVNMYAGAVTYSIQARARPEFADRVIDLHYLDLERDPMGAVERVYAEAGLALTAPARQSIATMVAGRGKHRHGVHRYSLSDYGLTVAEVREAFGEYIEHYKVTLEN